MELLRGDSGLAAARAILAEPGIPVLEIDPHARGGATLAAVALASAASAVVLDAAATPGLEAVLASRSPLGAWDAKAVERVLLRTFGSGAPRWACLRLTELLLAGGRPALLAPTDLAARHGVELADPSAGLEAFAQHTRGLARVLAAQVPLLKRDGLTWPSRIEAGAVAPLAAMEHHGMAFDAERWKALDTATERERADVRRQLLDMFSTRGERDLLGAAPVDLDNDAALKQALARAGHPVADARRATLAALPPPLGPLLARYRELQKLANAYGESFLTHVAADGRLHATFEQIGASTGRLSCREPNLQSIVKDAPYRECFRAPTGRTLVIGDYATCELRILAEMSGDPVFADAFARGEDLHSTVASRVFGKPVSKTQNPELRERAKAVNFGLVYGMGAGGLARAVDVDLRQAEDLLRRYFETFPRIGAFLARSAHEALERGFARTLTGRRLYLDAGPDRSSRGAAERVAKNMPIQGTSADITKIALSRIHSRLAAEPGAFMVNTVHDEIVVECDEARAPTIHATLAAEMRAAGAEVLRAVPVAVDVATSRFWRK